MSTYTDKAWDGSKSRFTIEELLQAIPKSMAAYAKAQARAKGSDMPSKEECHLPYKEPDSSINLNGISAALSRVDQVKGPSTAQKESARAELERQQKAARRALGKPEVNSMSALLELVNKNIFGNSKIIPKQNAPINAFSNMEQEIQNIKDRVKNLGRLAQLLAEEEYNAQLQQEQQVAIEEQENTQQPETNIETLFIEDIETSEIEEAKHAPRIKSVKPLKPLEQPVEPSMEITDDDDGPNDDNDDDLPDEPKPKETISNDFRPLPDFMKLGIDRAAGPAIEDEMAAFVGQTKKDGSPVKCEDFYSVGCLLANNDLIEDRMRVIPALELQRLAEILQTRSKQSDTNHSRKVLSGHFTVVNPKIGVDSDISMNMNNPLKDVEPYTALIARAIFPLAEDDKDQAAAVEAVRRGRIKNLSITPFFDAVTCGHCGEESVYDYIIEDNTLTGLIVHPDVAYMFATLGKEVHCIMRTPDDDTAGGYSYQNMKVISADHSGYIAIQPMARHKMKLNPNSKIMCRLMAMPMMFMDSNAYAPKYCAFHGVEGQDLGGTKIVGVFSNVKGLINVAAVDAGAIGDARLVLTPQVRY